MYFATRKIRKKEKDNDELKLAFTEMQKHQVHTTHRLFPMLLK